jgi:hypothetical protein
VSAQTLGESKAAEIWITAFPSAERADASVTQQRSDIVRNVNGLAEISKARVSAHPHASLRFVQSKAQ